MIKLRVGGETRYTSCFKFSGGEVNAKIPESIIGMQGIKVTVTAKLRSSDDLMELLLVTDALERSCNFTYKALEIAYAPYARQDRVCNEGEALSAKVFANLINGLGYSRVYVYDCHSEVLAGMLDNCVNIGVEKILRRNEGINLLLEQKLVTLISPDAGANKKTLSLAKAYGGLPVVRADKVRDTATGEITGTEVYCDDLHGVNCLIVDDICDGGMTFIKLAEKLKEKGAASITLYVTHGIFSKGIDILLDSGIDCVYTTNSFCEIQHKQLKVINL